MPCLLALLWMLGGCETLGYYTQAVSGHLELTRARQSVTALLGDPDTPAELRQRLLLTRELLDFAERELSLPASGQYRHYVDLDRDAVVYNVMAAPRFDLEPLRWCFPVAGCVSYRGYFRRSRAEVKARTLAAEGFDVHVGAVAAYSTLGWFQDPLLSTFLWREEAELAELLFHELAHVRVYLPGDTVFNESYATFVGREGARRWLQAQGQEDALAAWQSGHDRRAYFVRFVLRWREQMAATYAALRAEEAATEAFEAAREGLWEGMRAAWLAQRPPDAQRYDGFFDAPPSHARLNTVADYHGQLAAFAGLFAAKDGDFERFHVAVADLATQDGAGRDAALAAFAASVELPPAAQDSSR